MELKLNNEIESLSPTLIATNFVNAFPLPDNVGLEVENKLISLVDELMLGYSSQGRSKELEKFQPEFNLVVCGLEEFETQMFESSCNKFAKIPIPRRQSFVYAIPTH